ncbi:peroxiredoxin, Ohr subfamily [Erythrobacter litoralis]|uniref:Organic hydroperoxide resistance protein n=1 Tax=Erythrobacter litoralis TaxID=39960 RepID=A0A074N3E9_9SPHN|nr:organic hydroperoxide resistance protein [Erythrobacter litoralis]AOL23839.1 peroxiredoxin, Ohr subfamily [Erythrobacter litoralis]KEO98678.1 organic hydroperoxide resistance protein [Erythrobacter litoralis]MEE4339037.1 organic hydroperoxide resistance protein [Erythrobacter sp.]
MKAMYTAHATATGGRAGHVETNDGIVSFDLAMPPEMGGPGGGANPEQLFAAGYSACFHGALQFVAGQDKTDVSGSSVTGHVSIGENDAGPGFKLGVVLDIDVPALSQAEAEALAEKTHQVCPYSNATRGNIEVELNVTGGKA